VEMTLFFGESGFIGDFRGGGGTCGGGMELTCEGDAKETFWTKGTTGKGIEKTSLMANTTKRLEMRGRDG